MKLEVSPTINEIGIQTLSTVNEIGTQTSLWHPDFSKNTVHSLQILWMKEKIIFYYKPKVARH